MKVITISGKSGAGKTTISYELAKVLPNFIFIDIWKIKEMFEPLKLKNRKPQNQICKDTIYFIMKQTLKQDISHNFILQESTRKAVKRYMKNYFKKEDKIYSFFLDVDLETALKRNEEREKDTMPKKHFIEQAKNNLPKPDKNDIVIDTSNKSKAQVINEILKIIEEKRSSKKVNLRKCV